MHWRLSLMPIPRPALGRPFWVTWVAASVSGLGDGLTLGALPLLAAALTHDPRLVSLVDAVTSLGWLLLGLVSGVVVDRYARLRLMWRVDAVRTLVATAFAVLVLLGHASIPLLLLTGLLLGLAAPFFDNAASAVLPELVGAAALEQANSYGQGSMLVASNLIGPPLGAVLFVISHGLPLAVDAATFGVAAVLVARLSARTSTTPTSPDEPRGRVLHELAQGLHYLWGHRVLRPLAVVLCVINGVTGGVVGLLVLYSLEVLRLPPAAYGWLITTFAVGGLGGALSAIQLTARLGTARCVSGSVLVFGTTVVLMGAFPVLAVVLPCLVLVGIASSVWAVVTIAYRQREIPERLLGRVTSVYRMVGFLTIPVGAAGAGLLAHGIGIRASYVLGGAAVVLAAALSRRPIHLIGSATGVTTSS